VLACPQPVLVEPVKKTVFAMSYCGSVFDQYRCTLLTTPTIRQSSRAFASAPVRQFWARADGDCAEPAAPPPLSAWIRTKATTTSSPTPPPPTAIGPPGMPMLEPPPRRSSICDVSRPAFLRKRIGEPSSRDAALLRTFSGTVPTVTAMGERLTRRGTLLRFGGLV